MFDFGLIWVGACRRWSDSVLVGTVLVRDGSDWPHYGQGRSILVWFSLGRVGARQRSPGGVGFSMR